MSYDIHLEDGNGCEVYDEVGYPYELNVTYNYQPFFVKAFGTEDGIRSIYGMSAKESIHVLESAMGKLGNDVDDDYWKPTEGNARKAIAELLSIAKSASATDWVWRGD